MKSFSKYYFTILFLSCISIVFGQENKKYGFIYGTIIDSVSREPIIGAVVYLLNIDKDNSIGAATDDNGHYKISKVPPGTHDIKIVYVGYLSKVKTNISIVGGDTVKLNEVLRYYAYYGENVAKEEVSKGVARIWIGGLIVKTQSPVPDSVIEAIHKKYGFEYVLIGCDPTGANEHNAVVEEYLEKRNGKGWKQKMEEELSKLEEYYKSKK